MLILPSSPWKTATQATTAAPPLRRVTVWLDELAPVQGAFAHAFEWALLLNLPLHGIVPADLPLATDALEACEAACKREGITWSHSGECSNESSIMEISRQLENDFCVVGAVLPPAQQQRVLQAALSRPQAGPLLCPIFWGWLRRALVIYDGRAPGNDYLHNAATICHGAGCPASVLTLAHSEGAARRLQDFAVEAFSGQGVKADFHTVVGRNAIGTVTMIADWCRCSHVILAKSARSVLRRWFERDWRRDMFDLASRFAVLPIPADRPWRPAFSNDS
ncbi:MAG TPA: hypothetical protein VGZ47_23200 [Gemmataceae bacterium]|nr:hypothetical protein [Gemmataceae bacterium]